MNALRPIIILIAVEIFQVLAFTHVSDSSTQNYMKIDEGIHPTKVSLLLYMLKPNVDSFKKKMNKNCLKL